MDYFFVEVTDTFGGEANYSWVKRYRVRATSERGAMRKVGKETVINWHCVVDYGDLQRWDSDSGATCAFVELWESILHDQHKTTDL